MTDLTNVTHLRYGTSPSYSLEDLNADRLLREFLVRCSVRIWSGEHHAWWRENRCGYTTHKMEAGIYRFADAYDATAHCGPEKRIQLQRVGIWDGSIPLATAAKREAGA